MCVASVHYHMYLVIYIHIGIGGHHLSLVLPRYVKTEVQEVVQDLARS